MKRVMPDLGLMTQAEFIGDLRSVRRFTRLWNKETHGGIEIFKPREYYYKDTDKSTNFESLFKFLGAYEDVIEGDYKGLRRAWLYLNKNKAISIEDNNIAPFVLNNLNKVFWNNAEGAVPENLSISTSIVIETKNPRLTSIQQSNINDLISANLSADTLKYNIENNYSLILDSLPITQEGSATVNKGFITDSVNNTNVPNRDLLDPDDAWVSTLARYALRQSSLNVNIVKVSTGTSTARPLPHKWGEITNTIVLDIEIPYKVFTLSDSTVNKISADLKSQINDESTNKQKTNFVIKSMSRADLDLEDEVIERNYTPWEGLATSSNIRFNSLWMYHPETNWVLKTEAFRNPTAFGFTHNELSTYLTSLIDTGYQKKKVAWYKKALAVVVFVIALVLAKPTGGKSLKLIAVAKMILVAALTLSLITLAFAVLGMTDWATAFSQVSKIIEPLVIVASIITLGVKIDELANRLAKEGLKEVLSSSAQDFVKDFVEDVVTGATDLISGTVSNASMMFTTELINLYTMSDRNKIKSLERKTADIKSEYADLAKEMNQESDALQGFMKIYAKPATADWSYYSSLYDMPYERGGGLLSMGNIQRTTKQAMRKAEYNEPIFDNIRIK